jgi:hypothetical protein
MRLLPVEAVVVHMQKTWTIDPYVTKEKKVGGKKGK